MRPLLWVVLLVAVVGSLAFAGARSGVMERHFIYFPERGLVASPSDFGLAFEDVAFSASDGARLHGWFVPGESDVTWLWFHGNAGNISHRLDNLKIIHDELGVNVFIFDYRGYGLSQGKPTEQGTYQDGEAALAYLRSRRDVNQEKVIYFGRSLGAAVAVEMATRHRPYALVLESPFTSIREMARLTYPFLPVWPFLRTKYDSLAKIGSVEAPVLVLHGDRDDIVPLETGRKLFLAAHEPKEFFVIQGAGHNDTYLVGGDGYLQALRRFVEDPARKSGG